MEFNVFVELLYPILSGDLNMSNFTRLLFNKITSFDNSDSIIFNQGDSTYKGYALGRRSINQLSKKIRPNVEPMLFVEYLDEFGDEIHSALIHSFKEYLPTINLYNASELIADLFKEIIYKASENNRGLNEKEKIEEIDYELLSECDYVCPLCNSNLVKRNNKEFSKQYKRIHLSIDNFNLFEELVKEIPEINGFLNQDLVICCNCYNKGLNEKDELSNLRKLIFAKKKIIEKHEIVEITSRIDIEAGILQIIKSFAEMKELPEKESSFNVLRIDSKIKNNPILLNHITDLVLIYYRFIEEQFKTLERNKQLRFNKVRNEVSQCFEMLDELELSQQKIFDSMVEWISKKSNCDDRLICAIFIAFFIQNCEVFYEVA